MVRMEEIKQLGTGTGFTEALFEGFAGIACAVRGDILSMLHIPVLLVLVLSHTCPCGTRET